MELGGLPLHPLVVHAVVVLVPLGALLAMALAVVPRGRFLVRWPAAVVAVAAAGSAWWARVSGTALLEDRPFLLDSAPLRRQLEEHQDLGELLSVAMTGYAGVVILAAWSLPGPSALVSGRGAQESRLPVLDRLLEALLVLGGVGVLTLVVLAGESGARAVWG